MQVGDVSNHVRLEKTRKLILKSHNTSVCDPAAPYHLPNGISALKFSTDCDAGIGRGSTRHPVSHLKIREKLRRNVKCGTHSYGHVCAYSSFSGEDRIYGLLGNSQNIREVTLAPSLRFHLFFYVSARMQLFMLPRLRYRKYRASRISRRSAQHG